MSCEPSTETTSDAIERGDMDGLTINYMAHLTQENCSKLGLLDRKSRSSIRCRTTGSSVFIRCNANATTHADAFPCFLSNLDSMYVSISSAMELLSQL
jgi:hypothetical protein